MRTRSSLFVLIALTALIAVTPAQAHSEWVHGEGISNYTDAYRTLEIAAIEQRLYRRVEHPARVRALKAEIQFAEARVDSLRRILAGYRPFTRFSTGNPLTITVERTKLDLLREELHVRNLRDHLRMENRYHRQRMQLYSLRIQASAARLTQLSLDTTEPKIEIVSHSAELPGKN